MKYNTQANAILCSDEGGGNGAGAGSAAVATAGCNNNWSNWGVGSRTQWDVTKTFYLGVEVLYSTLRSAQTLNGLIPATAGGVAFGGANVGTGVNEPVQLDGQPFALTATSCPDRLIEV